MSDVQYLKDGYKGINDYYVKEEDIKEANPRNDFIWSTAHCLVSERHEKVDLINMVSHLLHIINDNHVHVTYRKDVDFSSKIEKNCSHLMKDVFENEVEFNEMVAKFKQYGIEPYQYIENAILGKIVMDF